MRKSNNNIPRITRGNDFTVRVRVLRAVVSGGLSQLADIGLADCTGIAVAIISQTGRRRTMDDWSVYDDRLLVAFDETIPTGLWGLEVKGKDAQGKDWRDYRRPGEFLEIVESTAEATGLPAGNVYDVTLEIVPAALSPDLLSRLESSISDAKAAAQEARNARSGITFMETDTANAPAQEGQTALSGGKFYKAVAADDGTLSWQEAEPDTDKIYVDGTTAQSYVSVGGSLVRLDKENSDIIYSEVEEG